MGGSGFQVTDPRDIQELIDTTWEELTEDNLMEKSTSYSGPDDEEEDEEKAAPGNKLMLDSLAEGLWLLRTDFNSFTAWTLYDTGTETKANRGRKIGIV